MQYQDDYQQPTQQTIRMPSEKADFLDKIKPSKVVEDIRMKLLGKEKVRGVWIEQPFMKGKALTEEGAWDISTLMLPASSQNVSITKLNSRQISSRLLNLSGQAIEMCIRNWKEYGIRSSTMIGFVHQIVFTNSLASLNQPESEGIRRLFRDISSADFSQLPEEQSGGILNMFRK
jgi:hypothetical protein